MNGDSEHQITWTVEGPDSEGGHVRADAFVDKIDHLLSALNGIDTAVSGTSQPTLYYRIVALSHSSPASITIEPVVKPAVRSPGRDYIAVRHHRFFRELEAIKRNEPVSEDIDDALLHDLQDLAVGRGEVFAAATISNHEARVQIDEAFEANIAKMLADEYASYGSVEGKLEKLNIHGKARRVWLYPTVGADKILCDFPPGSREQILKAADHFVRAEGYKFFRPQSPYPFRVKVMEFDVLEDEEEGSLAELRGIAPNATGDMTSVDFVRSIRDEWE